MSMRRSAAAGRHGRGGDDRDRVRALLSDHASAHQQLASSTPAPDGTTNHDADLEAALAASVASGLTALEEDERIRAFCEVTGLPEYCARETLQAHQWHVQRAAGQYVPELLYIDPEKERLMREAAAAEVTPSSHPLRSLTLIYFALSPSLSPFTRTCSCRTRRPRWLLRWLRSRQPGQPRETGRPCCLRRSPDGVRRRRRRGWRRGKPSRQGSGRWLWTRRTSTRPGSAGTRRGACASPCACGYSRSFS